MGRYYLEENKQQIINLYINDKKSSCEIAKIFNTLDSSILNLLKRNNVSIRTIQEIWDYKNQKISLKDEEKIIDLYLKGKYSLRMILKEFGNIANVYQIKKILIKNNIQIRKRNEAAKIASQEKRVNRKFSENLKKKYSEMFKGKNNPNYNNKWTAEQRARMSQRQIEAFKNPEFAAKMQKAHWSNKPEIKEKMSQFHSERMAEKISNGTIQINTGYKTGWFESKKTGQILYYMSGFEKKRFQILEDNNLIKHFTNKHNIKLSYTDSNGKNRKYIPDLLIEYKDGTKVLEEIKGRIMNQEIFELKVKAAEKFCKENSITYRVIYKQDLKKV